MSRKRASVVSGVLAVALLALSPGLGSADNSGKGGSQGNAAGAGQGNGPSGGSGAPSGSGSSGGSGAPSGSGLSGGSGAASASGANGRNGTGPASGSSDANSASRGAGSPPGSGQGPVLADNVVSKGGPPVALHPLQAGSTLRTATDVDQKSLSTDALVNVSAALSTFSGGTVIAGNVAVTVPQAALAGLQNTAIAVTIRNVPSLPVPGGFGRYSPNGTLADISITGQSGSPITTFPVPITVALKYNAADVAMAAGKPEDLTAAFVVDANTPDIENPLHFPVGAFIAVPPSAVEHQEGLLKVSTQALGSVVLVMTNPVGYVQTIVPSAGVFSSFDDAAVELFSRKPLFSYLQVTQPQIGSRLLVIDPDTGNYGYVAAASVGPSGPPPARNIAAVVRSLRKS